MSGGEEGEDEQRSPGDSAGGASTLSDEARLVEGLRGRAEWARREFLTRAHDAVYARACRLTVDAGLRRDWTHDCLLRLTEEISDGRYTYRGPGTLWAWFRVRAPFLLLDLLRARRRLEARELPAEGIAGGLPDPPAGDDPSCDLERRETLVAIEACLASLSNDDQRTALAMLLYRGATYEEVAEALGRPLNTVRTDIRRGRMALRKCLIQRLDLDR